jgi:hypothetical protein
MKIELLQQFDASVLNYQGAMACQSFLYEICFLLDIIYGGLLLFYTH